ncbi:hypothetical protein LzC2_38110 [Planctomycetes bacterium LzC2]|uniref:Uncharacterized protein n=1 Tax=Alienimonas chondri TaxID=2681879 RepID=A0ABX1VHU8_9PLAN|nr:hypothetical protein [Alienimonas chondri]
MAAFANEAAQAAAESPTPEPAVATPNDFPATPATASVADPFAAAEVDQAAEPSVESIDRESLPSAPLWGAPSESTDAESTESVPDADAEGGGWQSRKSLEVDPFAGL